MHLNEKEVKALTKIIEMYIYDEERDFEELEHPNDHVYKDFLRLNKKINKTKKTILKF